MVKVLWFKIFIIFILANKLFASSDMMPTVFIGTYNASNNDTIKNLILPNTSSKEKSNNWSLSSYTEELLKTDFKDKLASDNFNLMLKEDFSNNLEEIISNKDISDKKVGFLHVDTFQNTNKYIYSKDEYITVTLSLIFAQIGEELNRNSANNDFEVRYTTGITVNGVIDVPINGKNRKKLIHNAYRKFYKQALGKLLDSIHKDNNTKQVSNFSSDDIFFSISKVIIGKRAKELISKVYSSEELAKKNIMLMMQENLIKDIRKEKKLDDIVLLYPNELNKIIVKNWTAYLKRMNEFSLDSSSNKSNVLIRRISPSCLRRNNQSRIVSLDGYEIEVIISKLYDQIFEEGESDSIHEIKASLGARIIISLDKKQKIDSLSSPLNVITKKKMSVGQAREYPVLDNSLKDVRKEKITKIIRKSIEVLTPKLTSTMIDVIKMRESNLTFNYKDFCKE